ELGGRLEEDAAAGERWIAEPGEPAFENFLHPRKTARRRERGAKNDVLESVRGGLEQLDFEVFLGVEMREEAALGEAEVFRQSGEREAGEPLAARQAEGAVEDALAGVGAFGHAAKIVRPVVFVKTIVGGSQFQVSAPAGLDSKHAGSPGDDIRA